MLEKDFYNEIMDFVETGRILDPDGKVLCPNIRYISSFEEAEEIATEQECEHCEYSWVELRADKIMKVLSVARNKDTKLYNFIKNDMESYRKNIDKAFYQRSLKGDMNDEAAEIGGELQADLFDCLIDHAVFGESSPFYKSIFMFFKHGLWVCGWEGELPNNDCSNGTWIVYKNE